MWLTTFIFHFLLDHYTTFTFHFPLSSYTTFICLCINHLRIIDCCRTLPVLSVLARLCHCALVIVHLSSCTCHRASCPMHGSKISSLPRWRCHPCTCPPHVTATSGGPLDAKRSAACQRSARRSRVEQSRAHTLAARSRVHGEMRRFRTTFVHSPLSFGRSSHACIWRGGKLLHGFMA